MFFIRQSEEQKLYYLKFLQLFSKISKLFSENTTPYIGYRVVENLFCKSFEAENLSRSDFTIDAYKKNTGFGLKTFIRKSSLQKIAEFNKDYSGFHLLKPEDKIIQISELRNKRILLVKNLFNLENFIYHYVVREPKYLTIVEEPMSFIDIDNISIDKKNQKVIKFNDSKSEYSFNISKSTLYKRFSAETGLRFSVDILEDPFDFIMNVFDEFSDLTTVQQEEVEFVILPLYGKQNGEKFVFKKSGLNQWNAGGRNRNKNEVYIPVPSWIHRRFPDFFPGLKKIFSLELPNKKILNAKMCQENRKGLMSNPNKKLGKWLLRDGLEIPPGTIITYKMLEDIGIDSVKIRKIDENNYKIDFLKTDSFELFEDENK